MKSTTRLSCVLALALSGSTAYVSAREETGLSRSPDISDISVIPGELPDVYSFAQVQSRLGEPNYDSAPAWSNVHRLPAGSSVPSPQPTRLSESQPARAGSPQVFRALPVSFEAASESAAVPAKDGPGHQRWLRYLDDKIRRNPAEVVTVVTEEASGNPNHVCEIVKTAIKASEADVAVTVRIVEAAALTRPESMRLTAQCAMAVMPDALGEIQALLARLDPAGRGDGLSAKDVDAKDAKAAVDQVGSAISPPNPLNRPPGPPPGIPDVIPPPFATDGAFTPPGQGGGPPPGGGPPNPPPGQS
jgi:hypothetical protein